MKCVIAYAVWLHVLCVLNVVELVHRLHVDGGPGEAFPPALGGRGEEAEGAP